MNRHEDGTRVVQLDVLGNNLLLTFNTDGYVAQAQLTFDEAQHFKDELIAQLKLMERKQDYASMASQGAIQDQS